MITAPPPIGRAEYLERQERARRAAHERGFDAIVAWGRGATQDHYADLFYLTGFCPQQPYVPDYANGATSFWRASGHCAALVPVSRPVALVAECEPDADDGVVADNVIVSSDVVAALGATIRAARAKRVAVLGAAAIAHRWWRALVGLVDADVILVEADELSWQLRTIKSPAELALLRHSARVGVRAMNAAMQTAAAGRTEADVAAAFLAAMAEQGGALLGMGLSSGGAAHRFAPNGGASGTTPFTMRALADGDVVRMDAYGSVGGYLFDLARTWVAGDHPSPDQRLLLDAVRAGVHAGIDSIRPGVTAGAVARACDDALAATEYVRRSGFPASTMNGAWGHGLGLAFEPPWIEPACESVLEEGMCLAIERRFENRGAGAMLAGAQYEDDVIVTASGAELIT